MTSRPLMISSLLIGFILVLAPAAQAAEHKIGFGAHFWRTVDDIADDGFDNIDDDGFAGVFSYQYVPESLLYFEFDVEYFGDGFGGSDDTAITPMAFVLVGRGLYGGVGVGLTFADSFVDDVSDPFFAARIGFQFSLVPNIQFDINANYRADAFNELDGADTDAITLGAVVRFTL